MRRANESETYPSVKPYVLTLALTWTAIVIASLTWDVYQTRQGTLDVARIQARASFMKDVVYRRWNAGHGGVYVPVTDETQPNPYLEVPERNITTQSKVVLTLMNPAYMTRQVNELAAKAFGIQGHITSLNPIRPANAPDLWEARALESFEHGAKEISSIEELKGNTYMRLFRPLVTEEGCLKCHAKQGYKLGHIRGGISVSVPMSPLWAVERSYLLTLYFGHGLLWLVGLAGIGFGVHRLSRQINERKRAENELKRHKDHLEERVAERTAELQMINQALGLEITERKQAEEKLKRSEMFLNAIVENIPDMVFVKDAVELRFVRFNKAGEDLIGYSREELIGRNDYDFFPKEEANFFTRKDREVLDRGTLLDIPEELIHTKHKGKRVLHTKKIPLLDEKGQPEYLLGISEDVTERKRVEEKIKEYSENLESMVEERTRELNRALYDTEEARDRIDGILKSIADGLIVTDMHNRVVLMNRAAEVLLDVRFSEVFDRPIDFAISDETLLNRLKSTLNAKETGAELDFQLPGDDPKNPRNMRARTSVIYDKKGEATGVVTIIHAVTFGHESDQSN